MLLLLYRSQKSKKIYHYYHYYYHCWRFFCLYCYHWDCNNVSYYCYYYDDFVRLLLLQSLYISMIHNRFCLSSDPERSLLENRHLTRNWSRTKRSISGWLVNLENLSARTSHVLQVNVIIQLIIHTPSHSRDFSKETFYVFVIPFAGRRLRQELN